MHPRFMVFLSIDRAAVDVYGKSAPIFVWICGLEIRTSYSNNAIQQQ